MAWVNEKTIEYSRRCDERSGLWGPEESTAFPAKIWLSRRVQTAYHFWLLYFYDGRRAPAPEHAIDNVLATQNERGGFGWGVPNPDDPLSSSACEDIDSVDPLVRLSPITDYRRDDVCTALVRARDWILSDFNSDGGAVFRRGAPFHYGHDLMFSAEGESALFATWFRSLSLAILDRSLHSADIGWQFLECPGYQFAPETAMATDDQK